MTEEPAPYGKPPQSSFEYQFNRLFEATGCRTQSELAAVLEVKHFSIADAKRRKVIPISWLFRLLKSSGVNPDWIANGTAPRFLYSAHPASTDTMPAYTTDELLAELMRRAIKTL